MNRNQRIGLVLGIVGVVLMIFAFTGKNKKPESRMEVVSAVMQSDREYAAEYNFSAISGKAASQTFTVPVGNKWVYVALPAYYTATFSSATANSGELDKLDGSKPLQLGEHTKLGNLPLAVAIRVPEGCRMTVSMVYNPALKGGVAKERVSSRKMVKREMRIDRPEEGAPKSVQII